MTRGRPFGSMYRQSVREPYPRWGEEIWLDRPGLPASLSMRVMLPREPGKAEGCLLIVHGMNEYIGRYGDIARHFARRFAVGGLDFHAHGLSNPILREADRALEAGIEEREVGDAYLDQTALRNLEPMRMDLDRALRRLLSVCRERLGADLPAFVLSHSLGSLVAATYLIEPWRQNDPRHHVKGIVLMGPAFSVTAVPGWRGWFANPFINLSFQAEEHRSASSAEPLPLLQQAVALTVSPLLNGLFEVCSWQGLRRVTTPVTPRWVVDYLTDWNEERARHRADGYIIRRTLLRYVKGVEREIASFRRRMAEFSTPYFLVYSGRDPITPAWGSEDFVRATRSRHPDNRLLALPDANHHEHLFSAPPLREELIEQTDRWLDLRLSNLNRQREISP